MANSSEPFNWSMLTRDNIASLVYSLESEIVKQKLTVAEFHKKISNVLKRYIPVRTRKHFCDKVDAGYVFVGGTYYSDYDEDYKKCIEVVFQYRTKEKTLCMSKRRFANVCYTVADAILHEIIHMRQFRRRNFKYLPDYASTAEKSELRQEQSYLGCSDEIDAYSFNIACELSEKFSYDRKKIVSYLNENQKNKKRRLNSWRMYLKAFQHDHNHPILQRVKKKVVRYLSAAEQGRPYKNKDWINW